MNGVKDMQGYRVALNLSYVLPDGGNSSESCDSQDDVETGAILVSISFLEFHGLYVAAQFTFS